LLVSTQAAGCEPAHEPPQDPTHIEKVVRCLLDAPSDVVAGSLYMQSSTFSFQSFCRDSCAWNPVIDGALLGGRT
jgi:hypothetical protein